jgi:hypothetical protein
LDVETVSKEISDDDEKLNKTEIGQDIIDIKKMMEIMKGEEIMQMQIMYYQDIVKKVQKCKKICENNRTLISKCN